MALKSVPSVIQLPGGRTLRAVPFKIIERDADGRAIKFEILPRGSNIVKADHCVLFAEESEIRAPGFAVR
jgi:hypothetical protein